VNQGQGEFADLEKPVGMPHPFQIQIFIPAKAGLHVHAQQFIENKAVIDALDGDFPALVAVEQFPPAVDHFGHAHRANPEILLAEVKIDAGFLLFRLEL